MLIFMHGLSTGHWSRAKGYLGLASSRRMGCRYKGVAKMNRIENVLKYLKYEAATNKVINKTSIILMK